MYSRNIKKHRVQWTLANIYSGDQAAQDYSVRFRKGSYFRLKHLRYLRKFSHFTYVTIFRELTYKQVNLGTYSHTGVEPSSCWGKSSARPIQPPGTIQTQMFLADYTTKNNANIDQAGQLNQSSPAQSCILSWDEQTFWEMLDSANIWGETESNISLLNVTELKYKHLSVWCQRAFALNMSLN